MTLRMNFDPASRYFIDRVPYLFEASDARHAFFRRDDGSQAVERFEWKALTQIVGGPRWDCQRRPRSVAEAQAQPDPHRCLLAEPEKQQLLVRNRWFFVCGTNRLYGEGDLLLSPAAVAAQYAVIKGYAAEEWAAYHEMRERPYFSSKASGFAFDASPSSILRWRRMVEKGGGRIDALIDRRGRTSKLDIDQESYVFIQQHLREYLLLQRHSGREVVEKTIRALHLENQRRTEDGREPLATRGKTVLWEWLRRFDRLEVDAGRQGTAHAKRKYLGVGKTDRATRPGQTFQVDEWEVDARTLMMNGPIREGLDQKTLDALPRTRRWLYVVIDVATRYIVGLVVASSQNSASAIRVLEMSTRDKGDLAQAAGAETEWRGFPFESIASDTGPAFRAGPTTRAVNEMLAEYTYPNVGEPQLRGIIERSFRTISHRAMPYIPGRTFSNPKERGDYPTEETAVLTDDQLALIFIRYVVDVYHHTPHSGLYGETPAEALERLGSTIGLPPQLPRTMRRRAFGLALSRTVTARGVTILGISYNSEDLQKLRRRSKNDPIACYIDPRDLGAVSVWTGREWLEVECSIENFHGVQIEEWLEVGRILRRRYAGAASLKEHTISDALEAIRSRASDAIRIMGVLPQQATPADIDRLEKELYHGLSVIEDDDFGLTDLDMAEDGIGYIIDTSDTGPEAPTDLPLPPVSGADDDEPDEEDDPDWWKKGDDL